MVTLQLFHDYRWFFLFSAGFFGLLVGSFLNVVILRLPKMLLSPELDNSLHNTFNLQFPASHCPECLHPISWFHNIPLLSFVWLKGQCYHCQEKISLRYPLIELLTLILSVIVANHFDISAATLAALLFTWQLIVLTFIDIDYTILPDQITLPFLWLGLLVNSCSLFITPIEAILGAAFGYLVLWSIYWIFKWVTNKEGIGYGDFKLLAMLGAWLGYQSLLSIILISSLLGAIVGISLILLYGRDKNLPIPFGPFLAIGGFTTLLWGEKFNQWYFTLVAL